MVATLEFTSLQGALVITGLCPELYLFSPPVKRQVTKNKSDHRCEVVKEVLRQIRVWDKDTTKKLEMTNERLHVERPDDTAERLDDTTAEIASDVMSKFEDPTSLRSFCVTVIIICF